MFTQSHTLEEVLHVLKALRIGHIEYEHELQDLIAKHLNGHGIHYQKEFRLAPRNRIDFLVEGGIGIEAKKDKPNRAQAIAQLERYAEYPDITALILVVKRSLDVPEEINGKPCRSIGLNKQWGIAL